MRFEVTFLGLIVAALTFEISGASAASAQSGEPKFLKPVVVVKKCMAYLEATFDPTMFLYNQIKKSGSFQSERLFFSKASADDVEQMNNLADVTDVAEFYFNAPGGVRPDQRINLNSVFVRGYEAFQPESNWLQPSENDSVLLSTTIRDKQTGDFVGLAQSRYFVFHKAMSVSYAIQPEFRGRGFALEAIQAHQKHWSQFTIVKSMHAFVLENNLASIAVLKKAGMHRVEYEDASSRGASPTVNTLVFRRFF